jgi:hypothetical protein
VAHLLEVSCDPFTLRAGLEKDTSRNVSAQDSGESIAARRDSQFLEGAVIMANAELGLEFVEIESYRVHGWPPGSCAQ